MIRKIMDRSFQALVGAGAMVLVATTAQAAMSPASMPSTSNVQTVACLLGAHVGPAGVCIGGYRPGYRAGYVHRCWINRWGRRVCN